MSHNFLKWYVVNLKVNVYWNIIICLRHWRSCFLYSRGEWVDVVEFNPPASLPASRFPTPGSVCSRASSCGSAGRRSCSCSSSGCRGCSPAALGSACASSARTGSHSGRGRWCAGRWREVLPGTETSISTARCKGPSLPPPGNNGTHVFAFQRPSLRPGKQTSRPILCNALEPRFALYWLTSLLATALESRLVISCSYSPSKRAQKTNKMRSRYFISKPIKSIQILMYLKWKTIYSTSAC